MFLASLETSRSFVPMTGSLETSRKSLFSLPNSLFCLYLKNSAFFLFRTKRRVLLLESGSPEEGRKARFLDRVGAECSFCKLPQTSKRGWAYSGIAIIRISNPPFPLSSEVFCSGRVSFQKAKFFS